MSLSKKQLFLDVAALQSQGVVVNFQGIEVDKLKHRSVMDETYGRDSMIYLSCASKDEAERLEASLHDRGHRTYPKYRQSTGRTVEVKVQYFRGRNWNV